MIVSHFQEHSHKCDEFKFLVLEKIQPHMYNRTDLNRILLGKKLYWIHRLKTFFIRMA